MLYACMELAVAMASLVASIGHWQKHDRPMGAGFLCLSVGMAATAAERLLPAYSRWLGGIGFGMLLIAAAFFVAALWRTRQRHHSTKTD
jgi:membrane protein implicated in regulation of membrane protease activity